jgi:hypothetical protein
LSVRPPALGPVHRRVLHAVFAAVFATGAAWLLLRRFGRTSGDFGPADSPWLAPCLRAHGAAAMAFLLVLGSVSAEHLRLGWRRRAQRPSGAALTAACAALVLTGWLLYYAGTDAVRARASLVHSAAGLLLPVLVVLHARGAARRRRGA